MAFLSKQIKLWRVLAALLLVFGASAAALWTVHWINAPKWRVLRAGMTKHEVKALMGEPTITNLDSSQDEQHDVWIYNDCGREARLGFHAGGLCSLYVVGSKGDELYRYRN